MVQSDSDEEESDTDEDMEGVAFAAPTASSSSSVGGSGSGGVIAWDDFQVSAPPAHRHSKVESMEVDGEEEEDPWHVEGSELDHGEATSSRKRKQQLKEAEREIARQEQRIQQGEEDEPECAEDFERLLLSTPNDSFAWIRYMAFEVWILTLPPFSASSHSIVVDSMY